MVLGALVGPRLRLPGLIDGLSHDNAYLIGLYGLARHFANLLNRAQLLPVPLSMMPVRPTARALGQTDRAKLNGLFH
jgi:hypothetical protein